jgi:hypothetical protein
VLVRTIQASPTLRVRGASLLPFNVIDLGVATAARRAADHTPLGRGTRSGVSASSSTAHHAHARAVKVERPIEVDTQLLSNTGGRRVGQDAGGLKVLGPDVDVEHLLGHVERRVELIDCA